MDQNENISLVDISKKLNSISWDILTMLAKSEFLTYKDIDKKSEASQDKLSKEIARLEGALLIDSKRDDVDKRFLNFFITEYGLNILKYRN